MRFAAGVPCLFIPLDCCGGKPLDFLHSTLLDSRGPCVDIRFDEVAFPSSSIASLKRSLYNDKHTVLKTKSGLLTGSICGIRSLGIIYEGPKCQRLSVNIYETDEKRCSKCAVAHGDPLFGWRLALVLQRVLVRASMPIFSGVIAS